MFDLQVLVVYFIKMKRMFTVSTVIAVWLTLTAIYYRKMTNDQLKDRVHSILSALLVIDNKNTVDSLRIAVGYDACQDVVVNASDLLECSHTNHTGLEEINSFDDLQAAYSHFFQHGAAAEFVNDTLSYFFSQFSNPFTRILFFGFAGDSYKATIFLTI